jgi:hypothetical protein
LSKQHELVVGDDGPQIPPAWMGPMGHGDSGIVQTWFNFFGE